jgi:cytochrome c553
MNRLGAIFLAAIFPAAGLWGQDNTPTWAFFVPGTSQPELAPRTGVYTLPGSKMSYTQPQIDDHMNPPDWFPENHPVPPPAVTHGTGGMAFACASCHLASGMGHPESGSLAGYPASYIDRQMAEFRSGVRTNHVIASATSKTDSVMYMVEIAKAWPESDINAAAAYYAALKPLPGWVTVVESKTVPKSYVNANHARFPLPGSETETLGERVIELPKDVELQKRRDPNSGTIAYVPEGAIARGKSLITGGPAPCATCHGAHLTGTAEVPSIAGRSPLYAFRELYMFKEGSRGGAMAGLMKPAVSRLSVQQMIDVVAYCATLDPTR